MVSLVYSRSSVVLDEAHQAHISYSLSWSFGRTSCPQPEPNGLPSQRIGHGKMMVVERQTCTPFARPVWSREESKGAMFKKYLATLGQQWLVRA
jgi:hypothetical protein